MKSLLFTLMVVSSVLVGATSLADDKPDASKDKRIDDSSRKCTKRCNAYNDKGVCIQWVCD